MLIKSQAGEHKGVNFTVLNGFLYVDGCQLTRNKIRKIVELVSLLGAEGIEIVKDVKTESNDGFFGPVVSPDWDAVEITNTPVSWTKDYDFMADDKEETDLGE